MNSLAYSEDLRQTRTTICMGFASYAILIWDHLITLSDEVEYVWAGRKGPLVYLFFLNRYLTPLSFAINLFAYLSPTWTPERCQHFVRYEGSMTLIGNNVAALMMLIRVYALYVSELAVVVLLALLYAVQLGVNSWLLTKGTAVVHDRRIHACTMIFGGTVRTVASAWAWLPLIYDTVVLMLIIYRTLSFVRLKTAGKVARVLLRDGILYYSAIFTVNLVLTTMIIGAPPGVQNITAQLEYLLSVAMMSRITLHLRKQGQQQESYDGVSPNSELPSQLCFKRPSTQAVPSRSAAEDPDATLTDSVDHSYKRVSRSGCYEMQSPSLATLSAIEFVSNRSSLSYDS